MKKIIVSGNARYGLAKSIATQFPNAEFASRSASPSTDLMQEQQMSEFVERTLGFDVYISCSCLYHFQQTLLLEKVHRRWTDCGHSGHILIMGSTADTPVKGTPQLYPIEKKALKAYARNLSMASLGGHGSAPSGVRITYISVGYLNTPSMERKHPEFHKINTDYLAKVMAWILDQPQSMNINEISIDPIQTAPETQL